MMPAFYRQRRTKSNRLLPLSKLTERLVSSGLRKRSQFLVKLISDWPVIAADLSKYCLPVDLQFQKGNRREGTLTLSVVSGRAPQIQMMSAELITQINRSLGFVAVSRIKLRQDLVRPDLHLSDEKDKAQDNQQNNLPLERLEAVTNQIQSPEVRAALIRLGRNIKQ